MRPACTSSRRSRTCLPSRSPRRRDRPRSVPFSPRTRRPPPASRRSTCLLPGPPEPGGGLGRSPRHPATPSNRPASGGPRAGLRSVHEGRISCAVVIAPSVDALLGISASRRWRRASLHASVLHTRRAEGSRNTRLGDLLSHNVGLVWQVGGSAGHTHEEGSPPHRHEEGFRWELRPELNGERESALEENGRRSDNSGGHVLYASPGARVNAPGRWSAFLSVGWAALRRVNGEEHDTRFRAVLGLSKAF